MHLKSINVDTEVMRGQLMRRKCETRERQPALFGLNSERWRETSPKEQRTTNARFAMQASKRVFSCYRVMLKLTSSWIEIRKGVVRPYYRRISLFLSSVSSESHRQRIDEEQMLTFMRKNVIEVSRSTVDLRSCIRSALDEGKLF